MFSVAAVVGKIRSMPNMIYADVPDESDLRAFYDEECKVAGISEMPMENEAMAVSRSRKHHIVVAFSGALDAVPHHEVVMKDSTGRIVGWDVPPELAHEVEGRTDLMWMCDDFVIDPNAMDGEVRVVLVPQKVSFIGEEDGVADPVAMYPSPSTDMMIRERYGITRDSKYVTVIIGFDELRSCRGPCPDRSGLP